MSSTTILPHADPNEKKLFECFNAFKQGSKIYRFGDVITEEDFNKIPPRNQKWFVAVSSTSKKPKAE